MEEKKENLNDVDNVEIEPLTEEDLESVSGGLQEFSCSGNNCSNSLAN